jgi:hypothetical protein
MLKVAGCSPIKLPSALPWPPGISERPCCEGDTHHKALAEICSFIFLFPSDDTQQVPTWYHENSFLIKKKKKKNADQSSHFPFQKCPGLT